MLVVDPWSVIYKQTAEALEGSAVDLRSIIYKRTTGDLDAVAVIS
ncbi:hypothetical protein [Halorubrum trapanicum]